MHWLSGRRLRALCWKETLQIFRDPSSILIAFFMPLLMLFIFGYGINLDFSRLRIGLQMEDAGADASGFASALRGLMGEPIKRSAQLSGEPVNRRKNGHSAPHRPARSLM